MSLRYDASQNAGPLQQGEILADIWELRPRHPTIEPPESVQVDSLWHEYMIAMSSACDLEFDFKARFPQEEIQETADESPFEAEQPKKIVPYVLLCDGYQESKIRNLADLKTKGALDHIDRNQDERYHHLAAGPIGESEEVILPDLYLDFKKIVALPTGSIYEGIRRGGITRVAVVRPPYLQNLTHRLYSFLSRVGIPD